jgi:hypothetical protein
MPKGDHQTAIRFPAAWVPRLQAVAGALSRPGIALTPSDALRAAIAEGLAVLEAQLQLADRAAAAPEVPASPAPPSLLQPSAGARRAAPSPAPPRSKRRPR